MRPTPTDRIGLSGHGERLKPELDVLVGGPLHATVKITPLTVAGYLRHDTMFEVRASWTGPPARNSGLPPVDGPVQADDVLNVLELELAQAIAQVAIDELRAGRVPDLLEAAKRFGGANPLSAI